MTMNAEADIAASKWQAIHTHWVVMILRAWVFG